MMVSVNETRPLLTSEQAYEAAFRFVAQYQARERASESLLLLLVAMMPTADQYRTNDPASWSDWQRCVADTLSGQAIPTVGSRKPGPNG